MGDSPYVKQSEYYSSGNLISAETSWYSELSIENRTGETIYAMNASGAIQSIDPTPNFSPLTRRVIVRCSTLNRNPVHRVPWLETSEKSKILMYDIDQKRLEEGPIFVPEAGLVLAMENDQFRMPDFNVLSTDFMTRQIQRKCIDYLNAGSSSPCFITANCHTTHIDRLFIIINDRVVSVAVSHDVTQNEHVTIICSRQTAHDRHVIADPKWDKLSLGSYDLRGVLWWFGTDLDTVQGKLNELNKQRASLLTPNEVTSKVEKLMSDAVAENTKLKETIECLKKELELVKRDLANHKVELANANDSARSSYEQTILANKLATEMQEKENLRRKQQLMEENAALQQEAQYAKYMADKRIADSKVQKEEISVRGAEVTNLGTVAKVAAVVVPIAVSGAIWLGRRTAEAAVVACCGNPIVGTAVSIGLLATSAMKYASDIMSWSSGFLSSLF